MKEKQPIVRKRYVTLKTEGYDEAVTEAEIGLLLEKKAELLKRVRQIRSEIKTRKGDTRKAKEGNDAR